MSEDQAAVVPVGRLRVPRVAMSGSAVVGLLHLLCVVSAPVCDVHAQSAYVAPYTFNILAGTPGIEGSADGTGSSAQFAVPGGVAVDSTGNVYVGDLYYDTIRKITPGGAVTTLAGVARVQGSSDGAGSAALFNGPWGLAVDNSGNIYVADDGNNSIREITPAGVVTTLAGAPHSSGSADGTGGAARFNFPAGLAVDASGNVYVADFENNTIRKIAPGGVVTTLAGTASPFGRSVDGTGSTAEFDGPYGVAVDASGNVFVSDQGSSTIRKIAPGGVVTTLAGTPGAIGFSDGTGSAAQFNHPGGLAADSSGNVYVADTSNNTIRVITPSGVVTTLAGAPGSALASDSGTGGSARFNVPGFLAVDTVGNVYVTDSGGNVVRWGALAVPVPTSPTMASGVYGQSFSYTAVFSGALNDLNASGLPEGLSIDKVSGVISGTVAANAGTYPVTLYGINGAGVGSVTLNIAISAPNGSAAYAHAPTGVSVLLGDGEAAVSFTAPAYTGGTEVSSYAVTATPSSGPAVTVTGLSSPITVTGLATGAVYTFTVAAVNGAGTGPQSPPESPNTLPVFQTQPLGQATYLGGTARFSAVAAGVPAPTYQWQLNGANISGATGQTLSISNAQLSDAGIYTVIAANPSGAVTSDGAAFSVNVTLPAFVTQPVGQSVNLGSTVTFAGAAQGVPSPTYQWQLNGADISGATAPTLTISNAQIADAGIYTLVATNSSGWVSSDPAALSVTVPITFATTVFATLPPSATGPNGVAVDGSGNVYVTAGDAIEKIAPDGGITLVAGSLTIAGSADGTGAAASFNNPEGIAADRFGNIYVADSGNNSIRKVTPLGVVTTIAGLIKGNADGVGIAAEFSDPAALAVDSGGNIFVADRGNNEVRKINPGGSTTTVVSASSFTFDSIVLNVQHALEQTNYSIWDVAVDSLGNVFTEVSVLQPASPFNQEYAPYAYVLKLSGAGTYSVMYSVQGAGAALAVSGNTGFYVLAGISLYQGTNLIGAAGQSVAIAADSNGRVFEANPSNHTVSIVAPVGSTPNISRQPIGATIAFGASVTLSVGASGTPAPTFQWQVDGNNIAGATSSNYVTSTPGIYTVLVTNSAGTITSAPAVVAAASRLGNISSRAFVGTGANVEIAGFVISGPVGSSKQILVRAAGPSLSQYGVAGVLARPVLTLFDSSGIPIATNTGWNTALNAVDMASAFSVAGAFTFQLDSADSAILTTLPSGSYTAQVAGLSGSTGVALAEVYEVARGSPQLINISTRAFVETGSSVEIGGFVIAGSQSARVLVRAIGPSLAQFGVTGVLARPSLNVVDSTGTSIASNTGWAMNSDPQAIAATAAAVGAFSLPQGSADCSLLLTLPPGAYTAVVSGVDGGSGVALVEVYQAP